MKTVILLLSLFLIFSSTALINAKNPDTTKKAAQQLHSNSRTSQSYPGNPKDTTKKQDTSKKNLSNTKGSSKSADTSKWVWEWVIVFSPVILFFMFLGFTLYWLKDFKLNQAMAENDPSNSTIKNSEYSTENINALLAKSPGAAVSTIYPPTISITEYRPSISRLIAFITSILSLIIGLTISCITIYSCLKGDPLPDFGKLSSVLVALGIGVVPYAFNKVSTAISTNKQNS